MVKTDRTCAVSECGRPLAHADHSTACPECWARLDRNLGDMAALVAELDTTIARQTRAGTRNGPRSSERPLPYNANAADALRLLHATLWPWVREGLDAHPSVPLPSPSVAGLAVALLHLRGWLVTHPEGYLACDEVGYAVDTARRAIDRAPDRVFAGPCDTPDCGTDLYALEGAAGVLCPVCGALRDVQAWRRSRLDDAADTLLTLTEMTRAIGDAGGVTVTRRRLEGWVNRGRLVRAGHIGGTATYRVGDVLDILDDCRRTQSA